MKTKTEQTTETETVPTVPPEADESAQQKTPEGVTLTAVAELRAEVEQLRETVRANSEARRDPVASIDAGAGGRSGPQLTKETLAKMKPAEIAELDWADVKRTLSGT